MWASHMLRDPVVVRRFILVQRVRNLRLDPFQQAPKRGCVDAGLACPALPEHELGLSTVVLPEGQLVVEK